jgi:uncharacterized protein YecT (DUF1311 family)
MREHRRVRAAATVRLAAAFFAAAATVAAQPGCAAAALAPPVIHERFSTPACTGSPGSRSTAQLIGCAEQDILRTDRLIDALNRRIFHRLPGTASRRDFIAGHRAWLRYRTSFCLSVSDAERGGTGAAVLDADCAEDVNTQRVKDLRNFAEDFPGS